MKKLFKTLTLMVATLLMPLNVIAAEVNTETKSSEIEINMEDCEKRLLTDEEALELGFPEEYVSNNNIYEISTQANVYEGNIPSELHSGDIGYEDLSVSNSFTGAAHKAYGSKIKFGVRVDSGNGNLLIQLRSYDSTWGGPLGSVQYEIFKNGRSWQSEWYSITSGQTFYFKYYVGTVGSSDDLPMKFRILLAVV